MLNRTQVQQALDAGGGLLRLEPSWVPRSFMVILKYFGPGNPDAKGLVTKKK